MSNRPEADRLRMVIETQSEIARSRLDVDEVMQRVVDRAREVTDAAAAVVEMADGEDMVYRAVSGTARPFLGLRVEAASSLSGLCVEAGQLLRSDDATTDPRTNTEICVRVGAVSMICLPLRHHHGHTVGVLKVYAPTAGAFDTADEETLGLLSGVIAAHLSNARDFAAARDESRRDALTELGNRRAYDEALTREAARAARYGSLLSLVLFDVDGFKAVNDLYGTPRGDAVLAEVGRLLGSARTSDQAFRVGGDEFALVLAETGLGDARRVGERLVEEVAESVQIAGQATVSMGAAEARSLDPRALHAEADAALYRSKQTRAATAARRSERRWPDRLTGSE